MADPTPAHPPPRSLVLLFLGVLRLGGLRNRFYEFKEVGLTPVKADIVKSPMIAESPVNMECRLVDILEYGDLPRRTSVVIGEVVRVHIKDSLYVNGQIQMSALKVLGRLGGDLYCRTKDIIEMKRPFIT